MAQRLGGDHGARRTRRRRGLQPDDAHKESPGGKGADKSASHSGKPTFMIGTAALLATMALTGSAQPGPAFGASP